MARHSRDRSFRFYGAPRHHQHLSQPCFCWPFNRCSAFDEIARWDGGPWTRRNPAYFSQINEPEPERCVCSR